MKLTSSNATCALLVYTKHFHPSIPHLTFTIAAISKITIFEAPKADQAQWEACHLFVDRWKSILEALKGSHL